MILPLPGVAQLKIEEVYEQRLTSPFGESLAEQ